MYMSNQGGEKELICSLSMPYQEWFAFSYCEASNTQMQAHKWAMIKITNSNFSSAIRFVDVGWSKKDSSIFLRTLAKSRTLKKKESDTSPRKKLNEVAYSINNTMYSGIKAKISYDS